MGEDTEEVLEIRRFSYPLSRMINRTNQRKKESKKICRWTMIIRDLT